MSQHRRHPRPTRRRVLRDLAGWSLLGTLASGCDRGKAAPAATESETASRPAEPPLRNPADTDTPVSQDPPIVFFGNVAELEHEVAVFESVFWEPADTDSLRRWITHSGLIEGRSVLEIGTGSGLLSLCCLATGADAVVATDINPLAVQNARYNAEEMQLDDRFECRQVPRRKPGAWTVIRPDERFDVIVSNPPWEDARPSTVADFALYDPGFELLQSLLSGARSHLNPGGRILLAYGCVTAIRMVLQVAERESLAVHVHDDRRLEDLSENFLPGMMIELTVQ